jgi:hypothetical protein
VTPKNSAGVDLLDTASDYYGVPPINWMFWVGFDAYEDTVEDSFLGGGECWGRHVLKRPFFAFFLSTCDWNTEMLTPRLIRVVPATFDFHFGLLSSKTTRICKTLSITRL